MGTYTYMVVLLDCFHFGNTRTILTLASTGEITFEIAVIVSNLLNHYEISIAMPETADDSYDAGECSSISLE